jgi:hypothetical protein
VYIEHLQVARFIYALGHFGIIAVKAVCADKIEIGLPRLVFDNLLSQLRWS